MYSRFRQYTGLRGYGAYRNPRTSHTARAVMAHGQRRHRMMRGPLLRRRIARTVRVRVRVPKYRVRGRGGFFQDLWDGVKSVGSTALRVISLPGSSILGRTLTGSGRYHRGVVHSRTRSSRHGMARGTSGVIGEGQSPPGFHDSGNANVIVHREYIGDIISSSSVGEFKIQSFSINPGLFQLFPWMHQVASNFTKWSPEGIVLEFKSTSTDAISGTTSELGQIACTTNYDSGAAPFDSVTEMLNYGKSTAAKPSISFLHAVECARRDMPYRQLFVRSGPVPEGRDPRLYDLGLFQIASFGCPFASQVLGQLWISYKIRLSVPTLQNNSAFGGGILSDFFVNPTGSGVDASHPLGTVTKAKSDTTNTIGGIYYTTGSPNYYSFPLEVSAGSFQFTYWCFGDSTKNAEGPVFAAESGCEIIKSEFSGSDMQYGNTVATDEESEVAMQTAMIRVTSPGAIVTLTATTLPANVDVAWLFVTQINATQAFNDNGSGGILAIADPSMRVKTAWEKRMEKHRKDLPASKYHSPDALLKASGPHYPVNVRSVRLSTDDDDGDDCDDPLMKQRLAADKSSDSAKAAKDHTPLARVRQSDQLSRNPAMVGPTRPVVPSAPAAPAQSPARARQLIPLPRRNA